MKKCSFVISATESKTDINIYKSGYNINMY